MFLFLYIFSIICIQCIGYISIYLLGIRCNILIKHDEDLLKYIFGFSLYAATVNDGFSRNFYGEVRIDVCLFRAII
jgi:hypothetical protein